VRFALIPQSLGSVKAQLRFDVMCITTLGLCNEPRVAITVSPTPSIVSVCATLPVANIALCGHASLGTTPIAPGRRPGPIGQEARRLAGISPRLGCPDAHDDVSGLVRAASQMRE
jgi:hypothetical protein